MTPPTLSDGNAFVQDQTKSKDLEGITEESLGKQVDIDSLIRDSFHGNSDTGSKHEY
jgi:hypothetical protein